MIYILFAFFVLRMLRKGAGVFNRALQEGGVKEFFLLISASAAANDRAFV